MPNFNVKSEKEADALVRKFIDTFIEELALTIRDEAKINILVNGTDDTGALRNSISAEKKSFGYQVKADAPHAIYVEYGTLPHYPPIAPLKAWARRKLGDESAAWAVQKKIGKYGTKAQPFMEPAYHAGFELAFDSTVKRLRT